MSISTGPNGELSINLDSHLVGYNPRRRAVLYHCEVHQDTNGRFAITADGSRCIYGGWRHGIVCKSLLSGDVIWENGSLQKIDSIYLDEIGDRIVVSGAAMMPTCGVGILDLATGQILDLPVKAKASESLLYKIVCPSEKGECELIQDRSFRIFWRWNDLATGSSVEFDGPANPPLSVAICDRRIAFGDRDLKAGIFDIDRSSYTPFLPQFSFNCDGVFPILRVPGENRLLGVAQDVDGGPDSVFVEIAKDGIRIFSRVDAAAIGAFAEKGELFATEGGGIYNVESGELIDEVDWQHLVQSERI